MFILKEAYTNEQFTINTPLVVIGVFDSPEEITDAMLEDYYGEIEYVESFYFEDSGLEWHRLIKLKEGEQASSSVCNYVYLELIVFPLNVMVSQ
jgi:hypothetical protein